MKTEESANMHDKRLRLGSLFVMNIFILFVDNQGDGCIICDGISGKQDTDHPDIILE